MSNHCAVGCVLSNSAKGRLNSFGSEEREYFLRAGFALTDLRREPMRRGLVHRGMKTSKKKSPVEPLAPFVDPADVRDRPLRDNVATRAKELWIGYGRPEGRDDEIWLEAERQLLGVDSQVRAEGGGSVAAKPRAQSQTAISTDNGRKTE